MAQLTVEVPDELTEEAKQLSTDEVNSLVSKALQEGLSERFLFRVADKLLDKSELTDEQITELSDGLKKRVAKRHGS